MRTGVLTIAFGLVLTIVLYALVRCGLGEDAAQRQRIEQLERENHALREDNELLRAINARVTVRLTEELKAKNEVPKKAAKAE